MTRAMRWWGLGAIACVLLASGCSSSAGRPAQGGPSASAGVRLAPDPPFAASRITVVLDDPSLDPAKCQFEWRRNGTVIADARGGSLEPSGFSKGDRIAVAVTIVDPTGGKARMLGAEARVANSPPKVTRATLVMATTPAGAELQARVDCADPDGDSTTYAYQWFRNGNRIKDAAGESLPAGGLGRGDRIAVEVVASDGEAESPPVRSDQLELDNRPPQFTSQPPAPRAGDVAFHYVAVAVDPDGDPLRYELSSAPEGMTIDPQGALDWSLPPRGSAGGEYAVGIRASDGKGGEAVQTFTIHLGPPQAKR